MNQNEIKLNHNEIEVNQNEIKLNHNKIEVNQNEIKFNYNEIGVNQNAIKWNHNEIEMNQNEKQSGLAIAICEDLDTDKSRLVGMITDYLKQNRQQARIDTFSSGEEFLAGDTSIYSLVFFDIYMDKLNGMETAKKLIAENSNVQIVFASTSRDFAAESYDVSALHYLIKPVEEKKLFLVLDRFFQSVKQLRTMNVKVGRTEQTVYLQDILYIESENKKTILHTKQGEIIASMPFSYFCDTLEEPEFVKTIRYALVAVGAITRVPSEVVMLSDGTELPVSRGERQHVKEVFTDYKWKSAFEGRGDRA